MIDTLPNYARELICLARVWLRRSSPMFPAVPERVRESLTEGWALSHGAWLVSPAPVRRARLPHRVHLGRILDPRGNRSGRRRFAAGTTHDFRRRSAIHRVSNRSGPRKRIQPVRGGAGSNWYVRTGGASTNGGSSSSLTPDRSGTDMGVTNASTQVTSTSAAFGAGDVGKGICIATVHYRIATFTNSTTIQLDETYGGTTGTNKAWAIGGAVSDPAYLTSVSVGVSLLRDNDIIWIGAGTYRNLQGVNNIDTHAATVTWQGDVDGVNTGDPGEVKITAFLTNDKTAPSSTTLLTLGAKNFWAFSKITFIGGNASMITNASGSHDCSWTDCTFYGFVSQYTFNMTTAADAAANLTWNRCLFVAGGGFTQYAIALNFSKSATADTNTACVIKNSSFLWPPNTAIIEAAVAGANTFFGGGVTVNANTFFGCTSNTISCVAANCSKIYPTLVYNNLFVNCANSFLNGGTLGQAVEDYNVVSPGTASVANANVGAHTVGSYAPLLSVGQEPVVGARVRPPLVPLSGSPFLGFGHGFVAAGSPGTMADDTTVGTITWATPNNAKLPDASNATATTVSNGDQSHYLKATNFGFALPSDAVIQGVLVEVNRDTTVAASNQEAASVKLVKGGVIGGNDKSSVTNFTAAMVLTSYGALNDLWGNTLTATDINASNFGVVFSIKQTSATAGVANVDWIRIAVAYTSASSLLTVDLYNQPRPAGGGSALNAIGALERANTAVKETSTTHTGATSLKIVGPGYQDKDIPVDAVSTTLTVYVRRDSTYAGTNPQIGVRGGSECGVADAITTDAGAANAWNTLTLTFTPTAKGIVTLRLISNDTNGAGTAYFDED